MSQPCRTTSNPPFCVQRCVNSHACSSLGKSIPARSRTCAAFVVVRQPPALSDGGKYSPAWATRKVETSNSRDEKATNEQPSAEKEGEFKYRTTLFPPGNAGNPGHGSPLTPSPARAWCQWRRRTCRFPAPCVAASRRKDLAADN